jgi:hypothetical protein
MVFVRPTYQGRYEKTAADFDNQPGAQRLKIQRGHIAFTMRGRNIYNIIYSGMCLQQHAACNMLDLTMYTLLLKAVTALPAEQSQARRPGRLVTRT